MAHVPEDENFDEFMNASAEEWSKPEETTPEPEAEYEHDRWGSPIPEEASMTDEKRVESKPVSEYKSYDEPPKKKGKLKWWVIVIIVIVILCICVCVASIAGLSWFDIDNFKDIPLEFNSW